MIKDLELHREQMRKLDGTIAQVGAKARELLGTGHIVGCAGPRRGGCSVRSACGICGCEPGGS
eukprot:3187630-Rhodomonas_salina.2